MAKKRLSDDSPFLPLALFIVLCILITAVGIIREIKKEKVPVPVPPVKEEKPSVIKKAIPPYGKEKAQIGIIIDDLGWNKDIVKEIEKLNRPIAVSILPYAPYSKDVFNEFKRDDAIEILLHLPLEPRPPVQSLDKGVIKTEMSNEEINRQFYEALKDFYPGVKGINNHQGSLFTSDEEKMRILLGAIQSKGLFFVDSMTARQSRGYTLAKEMGIKTAKRDIFLDNQSDPKYIEGQIRELVETAKKQGKAIGIGHARKNTVAVLKDMLPEIEKEGVEIVPVSSLLE
ncbi:MAG TPA: divergent polysaccharide deacetylase family protein [bacterium]|nr:divergent polysaccharide deacetylase family protein [bacterium]HPP29379.1 divergent polysaccharide deacetylase family protein [bacterium]